MGQICSDLAEIRQKCRSATKIRWLKMILSVGTSTLLVGTFTALIERSPNLPSDGTSFGIYLI